MEQANNILAVGTLRPADEAMRGHSWKFNVQGTCIELDGQLFSNAREMYCRQVYFVRPNFEIHKDDLVVDIGANFGLFSVLAAKRGARVIAIEAQAGFAREIDENAKRNGCRDQIEIESVMVGSGGLFGDPDVIARASHSEGHQPTLIRLADLLRSHNVGRIDFLKVDIEGSEFSLLMHDSEWLDCVQRIAMEVHHDFGEPAELVSYLRSRNFIVDITTGELRLVTTLTNESGYIFAWRKE